MDEVVSSPVSLKERIGSLDVLRGVAVLGILLMNSVCFSMVFAAYENPTVYDDLSGTGWWVWLSLHLIADQKFIAIFSILFGAGVCIFTDRADAKSHNVWPLQISRMGWLLLIGIVHAYCIWYGDILVTYAVAGVVLASLRKWDPKRLFILGAISLGIVTLLINHMFGMTVSHLPEEVIAEMRSTADLTSEVNANEIAAYTGSWTGQLVHRIPTSLMMHLFIVPFFVFWRVVGLMLMGMALYRWGVLSAKRSTIFYIKMIAIGLLIGMPLILVGVWQKSIHGWDPIRQHFVDGNWNIIGAGFVAFAWIGIVMLFCKQHRFALVRKAFAAVGRMALTNYIAQSLICTYLFYGHGLGWFGQVERLQLLGIVVAIWIFQIIFSLIWLHFFRFGPLEWAWRSATYLKFQPMLVSSRK
ncbi:MAG: DUF418 domain-containing protein [Phycisphaerales bacterium]|jgi:uncharacterized protein|nr:DUF418 domain-containing protein [Phycisphaerales bacterium]MDP6692976.1 DUF418 domain-containing protein [Phycisphaerales bacterium]